MTLKEKFDKVIVYPFSEYREQMQVLKEENTNECEKIADEFAIGFKWWSAKNIDLLLYVNSSNPIEIEKELLEIYKTEKGL
jgi:hypothetical protein